MYKLDIKLRHRGPCQNGDKNIMYKLDIKLWYRRPSQDGDKNIMYKFLIKCTIITLWNMYNINVQSCQGFLARILKKSKFFLGKRN